MCSRKKAGDARSSTVREKGPQSAATLMTPAALPASMSCGESPRKSARSGVAPSAESAWSTGAGSGLWRSVESIPTTTSMELVEMEPRERAVREVVGLARDERGGMTAGFQKRERVADAFELAQHLVVMRALERAIAGDHLLRLVFVRNEVAHLRDERCADPRDPFLIGGNRVGAVSGEGMVKCREEERDGVGERAVEIEEQREGKGTHARKLVNERGAAPSHVDPRPARRSRAAKDVRKTYYRMNP